MKKKIGALLLSCMLFLTGCGKTASDYYEAAQKYLTAGNYAKAIENYNQVLKLDPKNKDAYTGLAGAYLINGQKEEYASTLQAEIENIEDCDTSVYIALVDASISIATKDNTTTVMKFVLDQYNGNDAQFYVDVANEYSKNNMNDEYIAVLKEGYEKTSSDNINQLLNPKRFVANPEELMNRLLQVQNVYALTDLEEGCKYSPEVTTYYYLHGNRIEFCGKFDMETEQFNVKYGYLWNFSIELTDTGTLILGSSGAGLGDGYSVIHFHLEIQKDGAFMILTDKGKIDFNANGTTDGTKKSLSMSEQEYSHIINLNNHAFEPMGVQMSDFIDIDFLKKVLIQA